MVQWKRELKTVCCMFFSVSSVNNFSRMSGEVEELRNLDDGNTDAPHLRVFKSFLHPVITQNIINLVIDTKTSGGFGDIRRNHGSAAGCDVI